MLDSARSLSLVLIMFVGNACKADEPAKTPAGTPLATPVATPDATDAATSEGKRVVGELKRRLVTRLTEALAGGPVAAIEVCGTEAPAIATAVAGAGVTVGRATRKPRNPANLASDWRADALAYFEQQHAEGKKLDGAIWVRVLPSGRAAYAEPLVISNLCVTCHGPTDALAPDVKQVLATRYPGDQATGYALGDLRGIAWAELPAR